MAVWANGTDRTHNASSEHDLPPCNSIQCRIVENHVPVDDRDKVLMLDVLEMQRAHTAEYVKRWNHNGQKQRTQGDESAPSHDRADEAERPSDAAFVLEWRIAGHGASSR